MVSRTARPGRHAVRGFILDGFPRTSVQAEQLDELLAPATIDCVVNLVVPTETVFKRLASRRVCVDCGTNYSTSRPARGQWICDVCGGEVDPARGRHRSGDPRAARPLRSPDRSAHRPLRTLRASSLPVEGDGTLDEVTERLVAAVDPLLREANGEEASDPDRRRDREDAQGRAVSSPRCIEKTRRQSDPASRPLELDRVARDVLERPRRTLELPQLPRVPAVICTSPNNMIVHGIPGEYVLKEGDIISIDCGAIIEGYHGDAAYTARVGEISHEAQRAASTSPSARSGPGSTQMVDRQAPPRHRSSRAGGRRGGRVPVVRNYVGHAIGTAMHEDLRCRTTGRHAWTKAQGRQRLRHRADGQHRRPRDARVDTCARRLEATGPEPSSAYSVWNVACSGVSRMMGAPPGS